MGLLKFLSFGSWDIILKQDDITFFVAMVCIIAGTYILKLIVMATMDFSEVRGMIRWSITLLVRILQILLQLSVLFILVSIGNFNFLMAMLCVWFIYHILLGIYFVVDDYRGTYIYSINGWISRYIDVNFESYDTSFKNTKKFKNINKTIYEYRKNTIVG